MQDMGKHMITEQIGRPMVGELGTGAQLLLWGVRAWVDAVRRNSGVHAELANGFRLAGLDRYVPHLTRIMSCFAHGAWASLAVNPTLAPSITADEQRLLTVAAQAHRLCPRCIGNRLQAIWLHPDAALLAGQSLAVLARAFDQAGLPLDTNDDALDQMPFASAEHSAHPTLN